MVVAESWRARQAALLLHGLTPALREKVLAKLSGAESSLLRPLLDELAALGMPGPPATLVDELEDPSRQAAKTALERARALQADDVLRAFDGCTPQTVALLLRSADWPWEDEIIHRLPEPFRTRVLRESAAASARPPAAPGVLEVLCKCLCTGAAWMP